MPNFMFAFVTLQRVNLVAACPEVQLGLSHALLSAAISDVSPPPISPSESDSTWWPTDGPPCAGRLQEGQGTMSDILAVASRGPAAAPQLALLRRVTLSLLAADVGGAVGDSHVVQTSAAWAVQVSRVRPLP